MTEAIRFERVVRSFGATQALNGVSFSVTDGEFFSMLGPSGSGKTTCLRLIAGFDRPTSGEILLGRPVGRGDAALGARRQYGLPGLRPVPAHDRARERRLRADGPRRAQFHPPRQGRHDAGPGSTRRVRRSAHRRTLRRPAPAGRARPRLGPGTARPPARRALGCVGPETPPADARRTARLAAPGRHHLRLRHPRPERSARHVRPDRRVRSRQDRADRHAPRDLRSPRHRVRRRLRRRRQRPARRPFEPAPPGCDPSPNA